MESESLFTECPKCKRAVRKTEKRCPDCRTKINTLKLKHWLIAGVFAIFVFQLVVSGNDPSPDPTAIATKQLSTEDTIRKDLQLDYTWQTNDIVPIMTSDFTITNNSLYDIKDVTIQCEHFSKSDTNIDSNTRTIYEVFPSGKGRFFPEYNMGFIHDQAYKTSCTIKTFTVIE